MYLGEKQVLNLHCKSHTQPTFIRTFSLLSTDENFGSIKQTFKSRLDTKCHNN